MSARKRKASRSFRKTKLFFWFNVALLGVLGGWFVMQPPDRRVEVTKLVENYFEKNKRVELLEVAVDIYRLYYSADFVTTVARGDRTHLYGGEPKAEGFANPIRILRNKGFVVGYCDVLENPAWVAYRIHDVPSLTSPAPRPERFETDLRTVARVSASTYSNSGYDRGHMAPNYAIATRYGEEAQRETFLMSNIAPQKHALNAGTWKALEMEIATSYPARFQEIWVVVGPVFGARPVKLPGGTAVPEAFFMIMLDESGGRVRPQAFLFPQETPAGASASKFVVSIDEVERRTGLDFFADLDDVAESALEARPAQDLWSPRR